MFPSVISFVIIKPPKKQFKRASNFETLSECNISRDFDEIDNRFKQVKGLLNEQEPWIQRCFEMKYLEDRKLEDIYSEMNNKEWNYKTKNQVIYQMFKTREFLRTQLNDI